jgi:hypothetical protein
MRFAGAYQHGLRDALFARLNLAPGAFEADLEFASQLFGWMTQTQAGWDQFFHDWYCGAASTERAAASPQAALYVDALFAPVRAGLEARTPDDGAGRLAHRYFQRARPHTMQIDEVEALWTPIAERDDWSLFDAKIAQVAELKAALNLHEPVARIA